MRDFELLERKPTADELIDLRKSVDWGIRVRDAIEKGLNNSLYGVCIIAEGEVIGTARIVGDDSTCFYIQDVIVKPEYQRMGIGQMILERVMIYIRENACNGAVVGLMSAKGKEAFYERFGFWKRPNENCGHGMIQFWEKEEN